VRSRAPRARQFSKPRSPPYIIAYKPVLGQLERCYNPAVHAISADDRAAAGHTHHPPARLTRSQLFSISVLWLGLQFFWTSQQLAVMPVMVELFVGEADKHWYLGLIKGFGAAVVLVCQLTVGFLSDHAHSRLGRRRPFILYGMTSGCLAIVLFMLAPGYWWLFAAYMLIEATINAASVPFQSLLPDLVPRAQHAQAGSYMGLNHLGGNLLGLFAVMGMGLFFGDDVVRVFGVDRPAGYLLLLPLYLLFLLGSTLIVLLRADEIGWAQHARETFDGTMRTIRLLPGTLVSFPAAAGASLLSCMLASYAKVDLRRRPNFNWLAASRTVINFGYHTFLTFLAYYIGTNLDTRAWAASMGQDWEGGTLRSMVLALVLLGFVLGGLLGNLLSAPLAQRFSKKAIIAAGIASAAVLFIPVILTNSVWVAAGSGLFIGVGWGAFIAADWAFACSLMPGERTGSFMGIWDATSLLPQVLAPIIGGALVTAIVHAFSAQSGLEAAQVLGHRWLFATVVLYFLAGLVLLRPVREEAV
jgi:MFS family permease